jgi:hypothetical protein
LNPPFLDVKTRINLTHWELLGLIALSKAVALDGRSCFLLFKTGWISRELLKETRWSFFNYGLAPACQLEDREVLENPFFRAKKAGWSAKRKFFYFCATKEIIRAHESFRF